MPDNDLIRRFDALDAIRNSSTGSDALEQVSRIPAARPNAKVDGSPVAALPAHERPAPRTLEEAKDVLDEPDAAHAAAAIEDTTPRFGDDGGPDLPPAR